LDEKRAKHKEEQHQREERRLLDRWSRKPRTHRDGNNNEDLASTDHEAKTPEEAP
jgi:hypothetical protein